MGDDKRAAATELQKMGITNQFKASSEELGKYVHSFRLNATFFRSFQIIYVYFLVEKNSKYLFI